MAEFDYYIKSGLLKLAENQKQITNNQIEFLKKGVWELIVFENVCIISKSPKTKRDNENRLHSLNSKSVEFPSGYGFYAIHGVVFDEDLWKKVAHRQLTPKQVMQITNAEQRRVAINHYGWDTIFDYFNKKLIDKSTRPTSLAELYRVSGLAEDIEINIVRYKDPSTERWYVSQVPEVNDMDDSEITTADNAMAWKSWLTLKQYNEELEIEG